MLHFFFVVFAFIIIILLLPSSSFDDGSKTTCITSCSSAFSVTLLAPSSSLSSRRTKRYHHDAPAKMNNDDYAITTTTTVTEDAPEITEEQRTRVQNILNQVYGSNDSNAFHERRKTAIQYSQQDGVAMKLQSHQTVYGELGVDALITILDAIGVYCAADEGRGDTNTFLDIGSGDGILVEAAALLWPDHFRKSYGIEILPSLYERSLTFKKKLNNVVDDINKNEGTSTQHQQQCSCATTEYVLGDIYNVSDEEGDEEGDDDDDNHTNSRRRRRRRMQQILNETTIAVCFATTWSRGIPGRKLSKLSEALAKTLPVGARIIVIDGKLTNDHHRIINNNDDDNNDDDVSSSLLHFEYGGELRLYCPDTAPYSTAHLYTTATRITDRHSNNN